MTFLKKAFLASGLIGGAAGFYVWVSRPPAVSPDVAKAAELERTDPAAKAVAEMARFLAAAPASQIRAFTTAAGGQSTQPQAQPWERMLAYTQGAGRGLWIAQYLAGDAALGTSEEARKNLMDDPAGSAEDVRIVFKKLPPEFFNQRSQLVDLLGDLGLQAQPKDRGAIEEQLLETSRSVGAPVLADNNVTIPQAEALVAYYRLEPDHARRYEAYKAAFEAQTDPVVKSVLSRLAVTAPVLEKSPQATEPEASGAQPAVAAQMSPPAPAEAPPENAPREPASSEPAPPSQDRAAQDEVAPQPAEPASPAAESEAPADR